jgi:hypothetical protein
MVYRYINVLKELKMLNIKSNNKFSVVTVEKWEDYQIKKEEMNSKLNNKRTTSEHKQECKEIYITLFNKYKEQIEKDFTKKTRIISKCKECSDYALLTQEEQDDLFYDLMSVDMDKKFR